jgi:hypothetical protein
MQKINIVVAMIAVVTLINCGDKALDSSSNMDDIVTLEFRDYQYLRYKYFFLDDFYRVNLSDFHQVALGPQIPSEFAIDPNTLAVYTSESDSESNAQSREGVAWVNVDEPIIEQRGGVERGTWTQLDANDDYVLVAESGYIILNRPLQEEHALAVSYRTQEGRQIGNIQDDTLKLELIKAKDPRPPFPTWNLEWKNVYQIVPDSLQGPQGLGFDRTAIDVQILKEVPDEAPTAFQGNESFLQIFGLDLDNPPDQHIDADYIGLDELQGVLIFPDLTPFAPQHPIYRKLQDEVPEIYYQQEDMMAVSRYIIRIQY